MHCLYGSKTREPEDDSVESKNVALISHYMFNITTGGPGSVVGIATACGLDGPGIESRWGEIFRTSPDRP